jgi:hypothetical protein
MTPENYIITTDYATIKNDAIGSMTINLPSSVSIPSRGMATYSSDITIGTVGSSMRSAIYNSSTNRYQYATQTLYIYTSGAVNGGFAVGYDLYATVFRIDATTVRLGVFIPNPYNSTLTINSLGQTITAELATILPPFSA